ncbi:MAG: ribosome silencing factor [Bacteroidales bacterium]|nr:ribosome silencing factor [Bacteroidales bacterium]
MKVKEQVDNGGLLDIIIEGILLKKGQEIVNLDFADLENAVCSNFIICHANSNIQVEAITQSVKERVKEELNENPLHIEGLENAHWVLLDYGDVLVHVFQEEFRDFYKLEELWADAKIEKIDK